MAPSKKSRNANKKFFHINDISSKKEGASKNKKKRKLSDMLGMQWSKEELQLFYEAYRKYGKDWKKVAVSLRNRSVEMVEALYTLNKAYLSLPEGTASVAGLVAMMTDHYSVLEGSDSEQETDEGAGTSRKRQKPARGKSRHGNSKGVDNNLTGSTSHPVGLSRGYLSLLDERCSGENQVRAVGKRTPRVPISHSYDKNSTQTYFTPSRFGPNSKTTAKDDDDDAHEVALALTEASQRGVFPQVSPTPKRSKRNILSSPVQNNPRMVVECELSGKKLRCSETSEGKFEESPGSMEAENEDSGNKRKYLKEGINKRNKSYGRKLEIENGNKHLEDTKEACSGTEQGQMLGTGKEKHELDVTYEKNARITFKGPRKRSKKVLFGAGEGSEFDALQALADLSLMMPSGIDTDYETDKFKSPGRKNKKNHLIPGIEIGSNLGCTIPEVKEKAHLSNSRSHTTKQKSLVLKATEEVRKSAIKAKRSSHDAALTKQEKVGVPPEQSSSSTDKGKRDNSIASPVEIPSPNQFNLATRVRSRRKMGVPLNRIEKNSNNTEKLSNCLSWYRVRRWCNSEWFYSTIDYPWFAKRDFTEYLDHVGLNHVHRLTRVEWGVIRSSLGKPRIFSEQFLKEEKEKLNVYRESVRTYYAELRAGKREGLPTDLARPLSVGQHIVAIHPRTREVHDGRVLTVDRSRFRIQFDRPELGVEFVKDIDCMSLNSWEKIPAYLTEQNVALHNFIDNGLKRDRKLEDEKLRSHMKVTPSENLGTSGCPHLSSSTYSKSNLLKQVGSPSANLQANNGPDETMNPLQIKNSQPIIQAQSQAKEADVQALSQLTRALGKKEAVMCELRLMNDEMLENEKDGDSSLKDSEPFKKQYAAVLLLLSEINEQVSSALFCLRQRNTYEGNPAGVSKSSSDHAECDTPKSDSNVLETVECSKTKARTIVNAALQAMSRFKGEYGIEKMEEVIDHVNNQLSLNKSLLPNTKSTAEVYCNSSSQDHLATSPSNPMVDTTHVPPDLENKSQVPSELIAHCVATLLMIQKCTEREFPPADVAQILDSAVTSLQPFCSQNVSIYNEIQKCMGIIRSQILALIPTS